MTFARVLWFKRAATAMTLSVVCLSMNSATGPGGSEGFLSTWSHPSIVGNGADIANPTPTVQAPASVNPGTQARASASKVRVRPISVDNDAIPAVALRAYQRAAVIMAQSDARCGLTWELLAAIGRVESDHGRFAESSLDKQGVATPAIIGLPLNGKNGTLRIRDTDAGVLDQDPRHDRAVGPMQFIPSTWSVVGVDADGDSRRDPQDVDDAALAAGVHLCGGAESLDTTAGLRDSVLRYNHSSAYADMVIDLADQYADGNYAAPPVTSTATQLSPPTAARTDVDSPVVNPKTPPRAARDAPPADAGDDSPDTVTDREPRSENRGDDKSDRTDLKSVVKEPKRVESRPHSPKKGDTDDKNNGDDEGNEDDGDNEDVCAPEEVGDPETGECVLPDCEDSNGDGIYNEDDDGYLDDAGEGDEDGVGDGIPDTCVVPTALEQFDEETLAPTDATSESAVPTE